MLSGDTATVFVERQFATLGADLTVDTDGSAATYDSNTIPSGATIAAGTVVDSYLVHFDPNTIDTAVLSVTFDGEILGVIGDAAKLAGSDSLAFANPDVDDTGIRGTLVEELGGDEWTVSTDGHTIDITLKATDGLDELRILVRSSLQSVKTVPEPSTGILLGICTLPFAIHSRSQRTRRK